MEIGGRLWKEDSPHLSFLKTIKSVLFAPKI